MVSRLKFHYWNVVVVLALVLCETLVESQYYVEEEAPAPPGPLYLYNSDLVARAQPFVPTEEGRAFSGRSSAQNGEEENPGRMFAARSGRRSDSDEEDEDEDDQDMEMPARSFKKSMTHPPGRSRPVHLPPGFDDKVRKRMRINRKTRRAPLHGDPEGIDDEDDEGRKPESRLLWPFSIEITKGDKNKGWGGGGGGGGGPGGYGSYGHDHPPPFSAPPGYPYPPEHHHDHPPFHDHDKEYDPDDDPEVQKLRVEMFKMVKRTKKWKKIVKYNLAEVGAQIVTKVIEFLEFI